MKQKIKEIFAGSIAVKQETLNNNSDQIVAAVRLIVKCFKACYRNFD